LESTTDSVNAVTVAKYEGSLLGITLFYVAAAWKIGMVRNKVIHHLDRIAGYDKKGVWFDTTAVNIKL